MARLANLLELRANHNGCETTEGTHPEQPVDVLPSHALFVQAAHALGEAPVVRGHVSRHHRSTEVHGQRRLVALHELDRAEVEQLAAPPAAADLAEARAALRIQRPSIQQALVVDR